MNLKRGRQIDFGFGVGLCKKGLGLNPEWADMGIRNIVCKATDLFGGCRLTVTEGDWINSAGAHCPEPGRVLSVCIAYENFNQTLVDDLLEELARCIKRELDQESVCITVTEVLTGII